MEETLLEIRVVCGAPLSVRGAEREIVMIPFTGTAAGPLFTGAVTGPAADTQTIGPGGRFRLSARYLLEGRDAEGRACRVFIENEGSWEEGFRPRIVTDSPLLRDWETGSCAASVEAAPGGVTVRIFRRETPAGGIQGANNAEV